MFVHRTIKKKTNLALYADKFVGIDCRKKINSCSLHRLHKFVHRHPLVVDVSQLGRWIFSRWIQTTSSSLYTEHSLKAKIQIVSFCFKDVKAYYDEWSLNSTDSKKRTTV